MTEEQAGALCDLHTHSMFSDGASTPEQLVILAKEAGLSAIALTDHNTTGGLARFLAAGEKYGIETIPGVEFSTEHGGRELHIIALFVRPEHYLSIEDFTADMKKDKERADREAIERLALAGVTLDYDEIKRRSHGIINRSHIATEIFEKGYTKTRGEAWKKYLVPNGEFYIPPRRMDSLRTIDFIKEISAVSVLAHPYISADEDFINGFLREAVPRGLCAMETLYSEYSPKVEKRAFDAARSFSLLCSGGSDFHGEGREHIQIGVGKGNLRIPCSFAEQLRKALK